MKKKEMDPAMKTKYFLSFLAVIVFSVLISSCTGDHSKPIEPQTLLTDTLVATERTLPTARPTRTQKPTRTVTPTPGPTSTPTVPPVREFLNDVEQIAGVYPESVAIELEKGNIEFINPAIGISLEFPTMYAFDVKSEVDNGVWELIGGGLQDDRLLSVSIGIFPGENMPDPEDVESWYSPDPFGSLSTSSETIYFDDGFGVTFTELYSYKGHWGIDVVYTVVQKFDEEYVIGINYFLSEEIFDGTTIDDKILAGTELLTMIQDSYLQFDPVLGGVRSSEYRILLGVCPIETDESYGYTLENPILMTEALEDPLAASFLGPVMAGQYLETLLVDDQPVSYIRQGSISFADSIIDEYLVTDINGKTVTLYVDQYSFAPYRVPVGFECVGILRPDTLYEVWRDR